MRERTHWITHTRPAARIIGEGKKQNTEEKMITKKVVQRKNDKVPLTLILIAATIAVECADYGLDAN